MTVEDLPPARQKIKINKITYHGALGPLYGIWFKNILLNILTLWIYSFWAKTNMRRYNTHSMDLAGDRFEYLGTGKELFLGFIKIAPFYALFLIAFVVTEKMIAPWAATILLYGVIFYMIPVAGYGALKYRFNRLSWRGIRGRMAGSAFAYGLFHLKGTALKIATLGLMSPKIDIERFKERISHMQFGNVPLSFDDNKPHNLNKINTITMLLAVPTLMISRLWYGVALQKACIERLSADNIRFKYTATPGQILGHVLLNLIILVFTLGFGTPIILRRNMNLFAGIYVVGGDLDTSAITQTASQKAGLSEGIQDMFDIDDGLDTSLVG